MKTKSVNRIFVIIVLLGVHKESQCRVAYPPSCPNILSKADWGGRGSKAIQLTIIPVKYVIVHHTVTPNCKDEETCSKLITDIQYYHMNDLNFHDIGYNFLIGGDGNVYEGAGWHKISAQPTGYNTKSLRIGFVGTFTHELPNERQLEAAKKFLQCSVDKGELDQEYKLLGARSVSDTESPGLKLFRELQHWKGFTLSP